MKRWVLLGLVALLAGCDTLASLGYYRQSLAGHLDIVRRARPLDKWIAAPDTAPALRERLQLALRIRDFAVAELQLPDNRSYRSFAALDRPAAVWNVVAAPELSLTLQTWCFPVLGCVGYRGYFDEADAQALAAELRAQGLEVTVYGVPAYSTLGWMNWAGGDPLLNTFITYPEGELARIIFHELAHQVLYVPDDTTFNESFATAVEQLGGARWLATQAGEQARREYAEFDARRRQFRSLTLATRERLRQIYALAPGDTTERTRLLEQKQAAMAEFRSRYEALKVSWGGYAGYDPWVARANNASFGAQAAYDELVPGFEALFERQGRDWPAFYDAVRRLADTPADARRRALTNTTTTETPRGHGG